MTGVIVRVGRLGAVGVLLLSGIAAVTGTSSASVIKPFELSYSGDVYGNFLMAGNAVLGCPSGSPACVAAMERRGRGNNNDFDMQHVNVLGGAGTYDSSTSEVTIPARAAIAWAHLDWSANTGKYRLGRNLIQRCDAGVRQDDVPPPGDPLRAPVSLKIGSGPVRNVPPEAVSATAADEGGPHYYIAHADVQAALAAAPTGRPVRITVADVWAPEGYGCVGGWSLTLVYKYPSAGAAGDHQRRAVYIYEGHVLQRSSNPPTTVPISGFQAGAATEIRAGVVAYEGDYNVSGSRFAVNGTLLANPDDPGAGTSDFFDSYADGTVAPDFPNNMSVDAKYFAIPHHVVPPGDTSAALTFSTRGDTYLAQLLAFAVPLPEDFIRETAHPAEADPGEPVRYTISLISQVDTREAHDGLTVTLPPLTIAHYDHDAHASGGTIGVSTGGISWTGALSPGRPDVITYSVTVDDPPAGDTLREAIAGSGPEVPCQQARDPGCTAVIRIRRPRVVLCRAATAARAVTRVAQTRPPCLPASCAGPDEAVIAAALVGGLFCRSAVPGSQLPAVAGFGPVARRLPSLLSRPNQNWAPGISAMIMMRKPASTSTSCQPESP
jgi:hypothetical protein